MSKAIKYKSPIAGWIAGFIDAKKSLGYKYHNESKWMKQFDTYWTDQGYEETEVRPSKPVIHLPVGAEIAALFAEIDRYTPGKGNADVRPKSWKTRFKPLTWQNTAFIMTLTTCSSHCTRALPVISRTIVRMISGMNPS